MKRLEEIDGVFRVGDCLPFCGYADDALRLYSRRPTGCARPFGVRNDFREPPSMMATQELVVPKSIPMILLFFFCICLFSFIFYSSSFWLWGYGDFDSGRAHSSLTIVYPLTYSFKMVPSLFVTLFRFDRMVQMGIELLPF